MLYIKIVQIGKTKEKYFKEAEEEFIKRLSPYAKIKAITIPQSTIEKEGESIMKQLKQDEITVTLDIQGRQFSSEEFSKWIDTNSTKGKLTFIIGGPHGLAENVLNKANFSISFSKMTFTHQMIRMFLLEQLYRGITLINGKSYHY